jgi:uncharacterized protein YdeI (YjbR/CyaY-like superfamily)
MAKTAAASEPIASEPILAFESAADWHRWLAKNHAKSTGVLIKVAKGGSAPSVTYLEAVEGALTWGWIDGVRRAHDARWFLQRFTPRRKQSAWSKINCQKAEALIAAGKMKPPGLAEVERARADGRWDRAYDSPSKASVPADLEAALARNARARAFFAKLDGTNRFAILYRLQTAKKPQTRADRLARFVAMCARGETLHPTRARAAQKREKRA